MKRVVYHSSAVVSLCLFAVSVGFWVDSYLTFSIFHVRRATWGFSVESAAGEIKCVHITRLGGFYSFGWHTGLVTRERLDGNAISREGLSFHVLGLGAGWGYVPAGTAEKYHQVLIPHWLPATAFAVLPVFWLRRHRRHPAGHCQACGYNLRGTRSEKCPECGRPCHAPSNPVKKPARVISATSGSSDGVSIEIDDPRK